VVVERLPNTLIIHLQRIIFDMDTFMNKKLNSRIEFPNVLNMRPYMKDEVLKADKERLDKAKKE
jgi:2-oxo-4-hydroxy-4-carboxy--5-ureidoimidazoline (OHCU) decarboxylase